LVEDLDGAVCVVKEESAIGVEEVPIVEEAAEDEEFR
jgi:hypothetical protein